MEIIWFYLEKILFCPSTIQVVALENNMKEPKSFGGWFGVFNQGMLIIVFLYTLMGLLGYLKYGKETFGSITLNLPNDEWLSQTCKLIMALAIFISFALQAYVPVKIAWDDHLKKRIENRARHTMYEYIVRVSNVIICFLLALAIPRLGLFISLFGAFCLSVLGFVFPAIMELCVHWPDDLGPLKYIFVKDIAIILIGFVGLVCGTYVSLRDIFLSFQEEQPSN